VVPGKKRLRGKLSAIAVDLSLTFVGVLAALAVENFRESLHERGMEKEYLVAFRDALQSDTATINLELEKCFLKLNAATRLIEQIESKNPVPGEEFEETVQSILMLIDPAYNTAVYENLRSTGESRIIRSSTLRNSIIAHYLYLNKLITHQQSSIAEISYNKTFMDQFEYTEFNLSTRLSQKEILVRFQKSKPAQLYLKRLQKDMVVYRNSLIYSALPPTLILLEKVDMELKAQ